jgi:signal transduction histidine kinase
MRKLSAVVLAVFVAVAGVLYIGANRLVNDQEKRLLTERTAEVGELLNSAVGTSLQSSLVSFAAKAQQPAAFTQAAAAAVSSGSVAAVAVISHTSTGWVVSSGAGTALSVGQNVTGPRLALIESAGAKLQSDMIVVAQGQSRLALVLGPPSAPAGTVVYAEFVLDPARPVPVTQSEPFHELNVALYVGAKVDPGKLLLATATRLPLHGRVATSKVTVGAGTWLVAATARQPLAGPLAEEVPNILSLAALLIGLAMAVLVESIGRRRDYALALVKERTAALEESFTQVEAAQQALVTHERLAALGEMAATVGHELRNPLGVLTNALYLIRTAVSSTADDRLRRQLDTADREISAATLIVSDLLEFSRPRTANPTSIDVAELLTEAVSVAPPPTGVRIEFDNLDDVPPVTADRDQIRQVVLNLLTNAYEAMPDGGTVRLDARVEADAMQITVSDTGVGMDEQTLAQVFEPFFSSKIKGTGLGLAVSKRIVGKHDGTLTMQSRPGLGCTAVLTLPLVMTPVGASS